MAILIREANEKDIQDILTLFSVYIMETTHSFEYDVPSLDNFQDRFFAITEQFPWLVCEADGEIAGYAYASESFGRAAYQWDADCSIYLNEKFHRMGIASALYNCLFDLLRLQGYYNLYAIITANNTPSVKFHRTFGFSDIGIFHKSGYKMGVWLDDLWMEKRINQNEEDPVSPVAFSELEDRAVEEIFLAYSD